MSITREAKKCRQCGREIYFDGICVSFQAENERNDERGNRC